MDDGGASEFLQDLPNAPLVANIAIHDCQRPLADLLNPLQRRAAAVGEVIEYHDFLAGIEQFDAGMRPDIARPARPQDYWDVLAAFACPIGNLASRFNNVTLESGRRQDQAIPHRLSLRI